MSNSRRTSDGKVVQTVLLVDPAGVPYSASSSGGGGDASAANQVTGNASLASIDTKTPALVGGRQPVDGSGVVQPISVSSLPLPTGASTNAGITGVGSKTLTDINTTLGTPLQANGTVVMTNVDVALSTRLKPADTLAGVTSLGSITNALPVGSNVIGKVSIDQTTPGTTNKVSIGTDGTVSITGTVPLPTGAATSANQTSANSTLSTISTNTTKAFTPTGSYSSITTANTDQTILAANANRKFLSISVSPNSPGAISVRLDGGAVYDSTNSDFAGTYLPIGATIFLDASVPNTLIKAASSVAGARFTIIEG